MIGVFYLILIALIVKGYTSYDIYFDSANMYLKGFKGVLTIPLGRVRHIKKTWGSDMTIAGFTFYRYVIDYYDNENRSCEISFLTPIASDSPGVFEDKVKQVNGKVL